MDKCLRLVANDVAACPSGLIIHVERLALVSTQAPHVPIAIPISLGNNGPRVNAAGTPESFWYSINFESALVRPDGQPVPIPSTIEAMVGFVRTEAELLARQVGDDVESNVDFVSGVTGTLPMVIPRTERPPGMSNADFGTLNEVLTGYLNVIHGRPTETDLPGAADAEASGTPLPMATVLTTAVVQQLIADQIAFVPTSVATSLADLYPGAWWFTAKGLVDDLDNQVIDAQTNTVVDMMLVLHDRGDLDVFSSFATAALVYGLDEALDDIGNGVVLTAASVELLCDAVESDVIDTRTTRVLEHLVVAYATTFAGQQQPRTRIRNALVFVIARSPIGDAGTGTAEDHAQLLSGALCHDDAATTAPQSAITHGRHGRAPWSTMHVSRHSIRRRCSRSLQHRQR